MRRIAYIILLCSSIACGQRAQFMREDVTMHLERDGMRWSVEGLYWFYNPSEEAVYSEIFYPFPHRAGFGVEAITVHNLTANVELAFKQEDQYGISFHLHVLEHDTTLLHVQYRQILNGDSAVYILRTTQGWDAPLQRAEFKLMMPNNLKLNGLPWSPDHSYEIDDQTIYLWRKEQFLPDKDFRIRFYFPRPNAQTRN